MLVSATTDNIPVKVVLFIDRNDEKLLAEDIKP
jgi:hypothetical protein